MSNEPRYTEVWINEEHRFSSCSTCGAVVDDPQLHTAFHWALVTRLAGGAE